MLKNSTLLLSSCRSWQHICNPWHLSPSTSSCLLRKSITSQILLTLPGRRDSRAYVMVADGHSRHHHENLPWPEVTSTNSIPTPYQIFNQRKGSPYSKRRFYELVKMYHPDRHAIDEPPNSVPSATKLERYRLVIAANNILSDPVKRGAYDAYGAGWNGIPDVSTSQDSTEGSQTWGSYAGRGWGGGPGGPSQNATWEDWEKWYQREAGSEGKQSPMFFSNSTFLSLVLICAIFGGFGQVTGVGKYSMTLLEQRDALHDEISKELRLRRKEVAISGNREERIQSFLRQRDPYGQDVRDAQKDEYGKILPDADSGSREGLRGRF